MKRIWIFSAAVVGVGLFLVAALILLPYGKADRRAIQAIKLASALSTWARNGSNPDELEHILLEGQPHGWIRCVTNVIVNGENVESLIMVKRRDLEAGGYLLGCTNGLVVWVDRFGAVEVVREKVAGKR